MRSARAPRAAVAPAGCHTCCHVCLGDGICARLLPRARVHATQRHTTVASRHGRPCSPRLHPPVTLRPHPSLSLPSLPSPRFPPLVSLASRCARYCVRPARRQVAHVRNGFWDKVRFGFVQTLVKFAGSTTTALLLKKTPTMLKGPPE